VFEKWISEEIKKHIPDGIDFSSVDKNFDLWDRILDNEINHAIEQTTRYYHEMKYK
jgi:hypothetical protein